MDAAARAESLLLGGLISFFEAAGCQSQSLPYSRESCYGGDLWEAVKSLQIFEAACGLEARPRFLNSRKPGCLHFYQHCIIVLVRSCLILQY